MKVEDLISTEGEKTFQCPFCPFSTNAKNTSLKIHIQNIHYEIKHKCDRCDMQFNTKQILAKHIARLHEGKASFCDQCSYSAAERAKLREHKRVKHEGIWYKCEQCDFQSPNRTGLKKHDNIKHKGIQPAFKCDFCPHIATERGNLRQHIRSKHERVKETCSTCHLHFSSPQNLRKHTLSVHQGVRYNCEQCDFISPDKIKVRKHTEAIHDGKIHKCDQCDYTCSHESRMKHHIKYKHEGVRFNCDQCDFKAASSGSLARHTASIHEQRKFNCTICEYQCTDNFLLKKHIKTKHKLYSCEKCDYQVSDDFLQLKVHKLAEHDEKPSQDDKLGGKIFCSESTCTYSSMKSENVLLHWASHLSGEKVYFCDSCDYTAKTLTNLNNHTEKGIHVKALPPGMTACAIGNCTYRSFKPENMTKHEKSHKTKTKYPCDKHNCVYVGNTLVQLKEHSRREHANVRHTCNICGTASKSMGSLNRHMRTVHDIGIDLSCSLCEFKTKRDDNLKSHIRIEHEGVRYNCESCKFIAKCPQYLTLHKKVVHDGFRYKCDQCDSKATQIGQLYAHRKKVHGLTDNSGIKPKLEPDGPFKCCECDEEFAAPMHVRDHQKAEHGYLGCDHCSRVLKTSSSLKRHLLLCHKIKTPVIGTKPPDLFEGDDKSDRLECFDCKDDFPEKDLLRKHQIHVHAYLSCNHCKKIMKTKKNMNRHLRKIHKLKSDFSKKGEVSCTDCEFRSDRKDTLARHIRLLHTESEKKKCPECAYITANKTSMRHHMDGHSGEIFQCGECKYEGRSKALLDKHTNLMHEQIPIQCSVPTCDFQGKRYQLKSHVQLVHEEKYVCSFCQYKTGIKGTLDRHVRLKHIEDERRKCEECDYTTANKASMKNHMDIHSGQSFNCKECKYEGTTQALLNNHRRFMHEQSSIKCSWPHCEYEAKRNRLKIHIRFRHEGKSHNCPKCDYRGATLSLLKTHVEEQHTKSRLFKCEQCEHSSTNFGNLRKHKLYIHNRNRFNCNHCEFKTITLGILNGHKKTMHKAYSDILPKLEEKISTFDENQRSKNLFTCNICQKNLEGKSKHTAHKKRCSIKETVLNQCIKCSFTSETVRLLRQHYSKTHRLSKFKCDKCDYKTYLKSLLKRHKGLTHKEGEQLKCYSCDFETAASFLLKSHTEKNHEDKIFACEHKNCSYLSRDWDELKKHKSSSHKKVFFCSELGCDTVSNTLLDATLHSKVFHRPEEIYRKISASSSPSSAGEIEVENSIVTDGPDKDSFDLRHKNLEILGPNLEVKVDFGEVLEGIGDSSTGGENIAFTANREEVACPEGEVSTFLETFLEIGKTEISEILDDKTEEMSRERNKGPVDLKSKDSSQTFVECKADERKVQKENSENKRISFFGEERKAEKENSESEAMHLFGEDAGPLIRQQDSSMGDFQFR